MTVKTPSGNTSFANFANNRAVLLENSLGLIMTAFPIARAGAAFQKGIAIGKFQGVINPATPYGRLIESMKFGDVAGKVSPSESKTAAL